MQPLLRRVQDANDLGIPVHVIATDKSQNITFVNQSFENFTGFTKEEVVGRKCNFLQGKGTDPDDLQNVKDAVESMRETNVVILNYTKAQQAFWNTLRIRPVFSKNRVLQGYVGEIFSLPISSELLQSRPRLCFDDVLALTRVCSAIPRSLGTEQQAPKLLQYHSAVDDTMNTDSDSDSEVLPLRESPLQRHVNYTSRFFSSPTSAMSSGPGRQYEFVAETLLPTVHGRFRVRAYRDPLTGAEPLAMIVGDVEGQAGVLCRVHDQCQTSEVFGSLKCDCKEQLDTSLQKIQQQGGMILYLPQEGRGIGLANKVAAYAAQELGLDTVDANRKLGLPDDAREYVSVRDILLDLNISSIRLMTNNPRKIQELERLGVVIHERVSAVTKPNSEFSLAYVKAKKERMFHLFQEEDLVS